MLHGCNYSFFFFFTFNLQNLVLLNRALFLQCSSFKWSVNWRREFLGLQCGRFLFLNGCIFSGSGNLLNFSRGCNEFLLINLGCHLLLNGLLLDCGFVVLHGCNNGFFFFHFKFKVISIRGLFIFLQWRHFRICFFGRYSISSSGVGHNLQLFVIRNNLLHMNAFMSRRLTVDQT